MRPFPGKVVYRRAPNPEIVAARAHTGEVTHVPISIDSGFDWNPGQSRAAGWRRAYNVHLADLERMGVADRTILSRIRTDEAGREYTAVWKLTLDSMEVRLVSIYFSHRKNRKKGG